MPELRIQPNHKPIRDYYSSLKQLSLLHAAHEGAVRSAFGRLLDNCGLQFKWRLVEEFEVKKRGRHLWIDGAMVDPWSLAHGYWEAKDQDDDLAVEAKKKIDSGCLARFWGRTARLAHAPVPVRGSNLSWRR